VSLSYEISEPSDYSLPFENNFSKFLEEFRFRRESSLLWGLDLDLYRFFICKRFLDENLEIFDPSLTSSY